MTGNMVKWAVVLGSAAVLCFGQMETAFGEADFSYADVTDLEFCFSSGAGAWWTTLTIQEDGSFEGHYQDSDMGDTGDGYPNGTIYICDFFGKFSELVKENEYTYSAKVQNIETEKAPGITEYVDGIRCVYSEPYGMDHAEDVLFYMQGAQLEELPEEYRSWVGYYDLASTEDIVLPFVGLYNVAAEEGFSSYEKKGSTAEKPVYAIDAELEEIAVRAADMENRLNNEPLSQSEMNQLSGEIYTLWDDELNSMWKRIKEILPKDEMARLTEEEIAWISEKEAQVAAAGAQWEGGSMQPLAENGTAARITRERVYELAEYLRR